MVSTAPSPSRTEKRVSIVHVAIRAACIQQIIAIPLLAYEMPRGKQGLPMDAFAYFLYVISWPFSWWASRPAMLDEHEPDWLPFALWFLAQVLWSARICIVVIFWRRKYPLKAHATI
jgi:hypothetical protein